MTITARLIPFVLTAAVSCALPARQRLPHFPVRGTIEPGAASTIEKSTGLERTRGAPVG